MASSAIGREQEHDYRASTIMPDTKRLRTLRTNNRMQLAATISLWESEGATSVIVLSTRTVKGHSMSVYKTKWRCGSLGEDSWISAEEIEEFEKIAAEIRQHEANGRGEFKNESIGVAERAT